MFVCVCSWCRYTQHPDNYACNNGTYSDTVPGVSGGHAGCIECETGRYSHDDGEGKGSCDLARLGNFANEYVMIPCLRAWRVTIRSIQSVSTSEEDSIS